MQWNAENTTQHFECLHRPHSWSILSLESSKSYSTWVNEAETALFPGCWALKPFSDLCINVHTARTFFILQWRWNASNDEQNTFWICHCSSYGIYHPSTFTSISNGWLEHFISLMYWHDMAWSDTTAQLDSRSKLICGLRQWILQDACVKVCKWRALAEKLTSLQKTQ